MKPIIGIVSRSDRDSINSFLYCYEYYSRAVIQNGGIPIMILPTQNICHNDTVPSKAEKLNKYEKQDLRQVLRKCNGVIMPGGDKWFEYDEFVCQYMIDHNKPLLGICMGMQTLGYVDNKSNKEKIFKTEKNETILNHHQRGVKEVHKVNVMPNTLLHKIVGKDMLTVNSVHNYHVPQVTNFRISAISEDGLIEAIEDPTKKFVLGLQWHPEVLIETDEISNEIFKKFIENCKNN